MEKISVIIPTLGTRKSIIDTLNSVNSQIISNLFQVEVLIVVDDSVFDSDLLKFHHKYDIKVYKTGGQKGANYARNLGVKYSTGKWLAFLDDDDLWCKNKLIKQFEFRHENKLLFTKKLFFYEDCNKFHRTSKIHSGKLELINYVGSTSSIFLSKNLFIKVNGFDVSLCALQDWEFYLRLKEENCTFQFVEGTHIWYRELQNDRISTNLKKQIKASLSLLINMNVSMYFRLGIILHLSRILWKKLTFRF